MAVKEIRVIVTGGQEEKGQALTGLLKNAATTDPNALRFALESLTDVEVTQVAQKLHGELYRRVREK